MLHPGLCCTWDVQLTGEVLQRNMRVTVSAAVALMRACLECSESTKASKVGRVAKSVPRTLRIMCVH